MFGGIIVILILAWMFTPSSPSVRNQESEPQARQQYQPQPTSGHTNITHRDWRGVQCSQDGMRITAHILTPGVWWQVRFDYRDDRIEDLYPMDYKTGSMLVITNSYRAQEWRIKPGDKASTAIVSWEIVPDTGTPSG